ncbi:MAG TPA: cold-shock protein [Firmicutes bacterium]|jgi:cold shock CspA family protein|nr:cold-shock protein [Bacillota bacterium]
MVGYVFSWNEKRGWGFIRGQDDTDYFAHYKEILGMIGFRKLIPDDEVEFSVIPSGNPKNSAKAVKIRRCQ